MITFRGFSDRENDVEPKVRIKYISDMFYGHFSCISRSGMFIYEGCSNMNASSFITLITYMLRQNGIPFWKEL